MKTRFQSFVFRGLTLAVAWTLGTAGGAWARPQARVNLSDAEPRLSGDMTFNAHRAAYDGEHHWRIGEPRGSLTFTFHGRRSFTFHALGAVGRGQPYCFVNVAINGHGYWARRMIGRDWRDYTLPAGAFGPGENTVTIELQGATPFWIDDANIGAVAGPATAEPAAVVAAEPPPVSIAGAPRVDLRFSRAQVARMEFECEGADYDREYLNHWRITALHGFMDFRFHGTAPCIFRALGATREGRSYCFVDVFVNGRLFRERMFIDRDWRDYVLPASAFGPDENSVRIELVGETQFWIDGVRLGEAGERTVEPAPPVVQPPEPGPPGPRLPMRPEPRTPRPVPHGRPLLP